MAFSESDIEKIKSAVPPEFRPRPDQERLLGNSFLTVGAVAPTPLKGSENNLDPLTSEKAREWASLAVVATPGSSAAFMLTGAQAAIQNAAQEKTKQEERDADDRRAFDQIKAALDQRLAAIEAELAGLATRLADIHQRQAVLGVELEELDELGELHAASADPTNPRYKTLLAKYGLSPDDKDFDAKLKALKKARGDEHTTLGNEANDNIKRQGVLRDEEIKVQDIKRRLENADTPEEKAQIEKEAKTVLVAQQVAEVAQKSDDQKLKLLAAEIVAQDAGSEDYNKRSVAGNLSSVAASDISSFDPDSVPKNPAPAP